MIAKPFQKTDRNDPLLAAGDAAEKQMAFYLDRAFKTTATIQVFHGLRIKLPDELAAGHSEADYFQIDHLLLHKYGFCIVESKSVRSRVRVNQHGEWERLWNGRWNGMQSPVRQAESQAKALGKYLDFNASKLLSKVVFGMFQAHFGNFKFDQFVAISDNGSIDGTPDARGPNVMKAESIAAAFETLYSKYDSIGSVFSPIPILKFSQPEIDKFVPFLITNHVPNTPHQSRSMPEAAKQAESTSPTTPAKARSEPAIQSKTAHSSTEVKSASANQANSRPASNLEPLCCSKCKSPAVEVVFAKDYCLKCRTCQKYSPLDYSCTFCKKRARIRKSGLNFSRDCAECGKSLLFFVNPS